MAYVGFSFWCTWDDEHGLGVMTHKNRVVKIGGVDTALLNWIAESDLNSLKTNTGTENTNRIEDENTNRKNNKKTRQWWRFW